jgi:hypothetical protein
MAFEPNFSISQQLGTSNICTFTDTSTGSDSNITGMKIYMRKADDTYLVNGTNWALNTQKDIDILYRDYALFVRVDWVDGSLDILYTKEYAVDFTAYTSNFINELTQQETAIPNIENTVDYFQSKGQLQTLVSDANRAIQYGGDYKKAQVFLDNAYYIINNQTKFF